MSHRFVLDDRMEQEDCNLTTEGNLRSHVRQQLMRLRLSLNGRTWGSLARSTPSLYPTGYMLQLTFSLKTWCKWHLSLLIFNVAARGHLDYTTQAGYSLQYFKACYSSTVAKKMAVSRVKYFNNFGMQGSKSRIF